MNNLSETLTAGTARFADDRLAQAEQESGQAAAWRLALARPPKEAAAAARGHFAVGLHDDAGRGYGAVDRFAVHTLCYRADGNVLRFAERADALVGSNPELDPQALFDYMYFHAIPSPRTVFRGVRRLPPGHCVWSEGKGVEAARYWAPAFDEQAAPSFASARDRFRELLAQAVAAQLDGSRPASFLSGGTDSSTVAGLIGQVAGRPAATYSIGFEAEGYDEMAYARLAARHFGTDHHEYYITPADLVRSIPAMAAHHDQPFGNSSALPTYYCALRAREDGVTRLLAGDGGDELFGGNTRYAKQRVFEVYSALPGALRQSVLEPLTDRRLLDGLPGLRKVASYVRQARVPMPDRLQTYNLLDRLGREGMFTPAFMAQVDAGGPERQQREVWHEADGAGFVNKMLAFDWRYTLAENDLPKVRGSTQLAGVSVGYPFLDQAVAEFSEGLPQKYKLNRLKLRWFFKEALRGFLPDEILRKKKHGFGLPFGVWAVRDPGLHALARDSLRGLGERGIVQREFLTALLDRHLPEHPGYYGEMVWVLMMLEQWFRHHAPAYLVQG